MQSIEKIAKNFDEAVTEALKELNTTIDKVEVKVLEQGNKGFLGIFGTKPCKVLVTKKFDPVFIAQNFLNEVIDTMKISASTNITLKDRVLLIEIVGKDASKFIGKHGQTLDALQYLVNLVVNKGEAPFVNVSIDCENYRQKRKEALENLARNLAKKAKQIKRNVVLEPMSAYERRIIHSTLQSDKLVATYSEGEEPYRNVVISPKR